MVCISRLLLLLFLVLSLMDIFMYRLPYYHLLSRVLMDISMGPLVKMQKLPNKKKHANMHIVYRFVSDTTVLCTCTRKHMSGGHNYLLLANRHGQSGWSPIGCEGLYFHAMYKDRVSVTEWSPL